MPPNGSVFRNMVAMSKFLRSAAVGTLVLLLGAIVWLLFSPDAVPLPLPVDRPATDSTNTESAASAIAGTSVDAPSVGRTVTDGSETVPSGSRRISGRVVDRGGIGIGHAVVRAVINHRAFDFEVDVAWVERVADRPVRADGTFDLVLPIHCPFEIVAEARGFAPGVTAVASRAVGDIEVVVDVPTTLSGVVRDAVSGRPIPGATVTVEDKNRFIRRTATADAMGRFDVHDLRAGTSSVEVRAAGFGTLEDVVSLPEAAPFDYPVQLERGRTIRITVTDEKSRKPIAGAVAYWNFKRVAASDDGVIRMADLPSRSINVDVRHPDYGNRMVSLNLDGIATDVAVDVALPPARRVVGRVVGSDGSPISGAVVSLSPWMPSETAVEEVGAQRLDGIALTDAEGRYRITATDEIVERVTTAEGKEAWPLMVAARHPVHGWTSARRTVENLAEISEVEVDLAFERRASTVRGVVLDREGAAVAKALVAVHIVLARYMPLDAPEQSTATSVADVPIGVAETDDRGRFEIRGLPPGRHLIRAKGAAAASVEEPLPELADGATLDDVRVVLERLLECRGRVVDKDGKPMEHVSVIVRSGDVENRDGFERWTATQSDGRFICRIPMGLQPTFEFSLEGWASVTRTLEALTANPEVIIEPDGRFVAVSGRVVQGASKEPVFQASVTFEWDGPSEADPVFDRRHGDTTTAYGTTTADGAFEVRLPRGPWRCRATHDRFGVLPTTSLKVDAEIRGLEWQLQSPARVELLVDAKGTWRSFYAYLVPEASTLIDPQLQWPDAVGRLTWLVESPGRYRIVTLATPMLVDGGPWIEGSLCCAETPWFDVPAGGAVQRTLKPDAPIALKMKVVRDPEATTEPQESDRVQCRWVRVGELAGGPLGDTKSWDRIESLRDGKLGEVESSLMPGKDVDIPMVEGNYMLYATRGTWNVAKPFTITAGKKTEIVLEPPAAKPAESEPDDDAPREDG